nr:MAG: ORF1 [Torque teno midi virus]
MPFWWWKRRQRWYRPRRRWTTRRRKRRYYKKRTSRNRRRYRRPYRRRRRGRKKVRRKLKKLTLKQWQPQTIKKCKIKGFAIHILGAQGTQYRCYTDNQQAWTNSKAPGGGGFGYEKYTLQYLYNQYKMGNNIWTTSNKNLDLCRYTGCTFKFIRHPYMDFLVQYQLSYPMIQEKYSYASCFPKEMLLAKHSKLILSRKSKPFGKLWVKVKIKPPKLLSTKWFFQDAFKDTGLVTIKSTVCDLQYPDIGPLNNNQLTTIFALNLQFYVNGGWGNKTSETAPYMPYQGAQTTFNGKDINGKPLIGTIKTATYNDSIDYDTGWFQPKFLQLASNTIQNVIPTTLGRYNPTLDDGVGNEVWFSSILNQSYDRPRHDKSLIITDLPLPQIFYGLTDYIKKSKNDKTFLQTYVVLIASKYIYPYHDVGTKNYYLPIDLTFIQGKAPYGDYLTAAQKKLWFPTIQHQVQSINNIVQAGAYIPRLDNERYNTWELKSKYEFYFKWGGAETPDAQAEDPSKQATYDVPDKIKQAIQIANPSKQSPLSILHSWDYRRGLITPKAYRRMLENQSTDTDFQTDAEQPPTKKKKITNQMPLQREDQEEIEASLLNLYKENIYQETQEETTIQQLINQQQQQQQQLRDNLLTIISDLKKQQCLLQLQTGMLN